MLRHWITNLFAHSDLNVNVISGIDNAYNVDSKKSEKTDFEKRYKIILEKKKDKDENVPLWFLEIKEITNCLWVYARDTHCYLAYLIYLLKDPTNSS